MKRLFLISAAFLITSVSFAQTACNTDNSLFKFDNAGMPKDIEKLGKAPEFPFLKNLSTTAQVYSAIKKNDQKNIPGMEHFNDLMMAIGFPGGTKDLDKSNISMYYIAPGTEGNMGSAGYGNGFYRLSADASDLKAWKISSGTGCYVYILAKCGNAFYPKAATGKTACINAPVNLTGDMKEVTLSSSGQKVTTTDNVYVYYSHKHHKKHATAHPIAEIPDAYPSTPILLSSTKKVDVVPETYKVSVNTPDNTVNVCPDSTLNITANINVEKTSSYTGNYPDKTDKEYKKVSKHEYKMIARKMRRIERKEERIARRTGMNVDVAVNKNA